MKKLYTYTKEQVQELIKKEPAFSEYIQIIGDIEVNINPNIFESIIEAMIAQQISRKVAQIITNRLIEKVKKITPKKILLLTDEDFSQIGLGPQKRGYVRAISTSFSNGQIKEDELLKLNEEELKQELIKLKGVGEWTAEMLLIFSLGKPNILSYKDLGIKKGLVKLYNKNNIEEITSEFFEECKNKFSPLNTLASLYLWKIASLKY